jgi:hypothetical protein
LDNAAGRAWFQPEVTAALPLYVVWHHFCRAHKAHKLSPAMAAGVTDHLWSMDDIAALVEARAHKRGQRGPYETREMLA